MKKPKLKLIAAGAFALVLLAAVLALVNRPPALQAQPAWAEAAAAPWRIVQVPPKAPVGASPYPPALLINTATGETWELYCNPGCRWLPVER